MVADTEQVTAAMLGSATQLATTANAKALMRLHLRRLVAIGKPRCEFTLGKLLTMTIREEYGSAWLHTEIGISFESHTHIS